MIGAEEGGQGQDDQDLRDRALEEEQRVVAPEVEPALQVALEDGGQDKPSTMAGTEKRADHRIADEAGGHITQTSKRLLFTAKLPTTEKVMTITTSTGVGKRVTRWKNPAPAGPAPASARWR